MASTVLITGANGFIGSHTTLLMESLGHKVVALDAVPRSTDLSLLGIQTPSYIMDVTDAAAFRKLCDKENPTHIFHAAHPPRNENPSVINFCYHAMTNILEAAKALKMQRVVYSSSASIYGQLKKPDHSLVKEEDAVTIYPTYYSVAHSTSGGVLDISLDEWNRIMTINLTGYFLCVQHAGKIMKERGSGVIINISAGSGERSSPGGAAYSVSKGAINSLTRQAAADLAPYNIRVNGIISGLVGTPIGQKEMGNRKPEYDMIPLRRIGQPEDVAEAAVFLASDKASYITNTILPVDGGRLNAMNSASSR